MERLEGGRMGLTSVSAAPGGTHLTQGAGQAPEVRAHGALGFLRIDTVGGAARTYVHEPDDGAREPCLVLGIHTAGRAVLVRRGAGAACGPDDLFVCDGEEPFTLHEPVDFALHLVRIPRRVLALTDHGIRALCARAPFSDGAVAPLLVPLLRQLVGAPYAYPPRTALHLAGSVAEWVALLAVEDGDAGPQDHEEGDGAEAEGGQERDALVRRVRAHVDANLWDRGLTPASVATAQHISIRYLHKLFEDHDSTVGRWIQHRRLEEARRELARPGRDDTTVSAVARRWGFANATHFSRSFRARYGVSPSDWREDRTRPSLGTGDPNG
ncbi:helix-turn-helix domain-containing protein [Streptomyces sp. NPDC002573]|uniref:helix-turn-helix domain-containing protein n=1 Tax=Streptomyces sp. NPDC002573 TaxID=3364651 RepID=UPI0036C8D8E3